MFGQFLIFFLLPLYFYFLRHKCSTVIVGRKFERLKKVCISYVSINSNCGISLSPITPIPPSSLGLLPLVPSSRPPPVLPPPPPPKPQNPVLHISVVLHLLWYCKLTDLIFFYLFWQAAQKLEKCTGQRCLPIEMDVRKVCWSVWAN